MTRDNHFRGCQITVFWDIQKSSPNRKSLNWRVNAAIAAKARRAGVDGWLMANRPRSGVPVIIDVTVRRGRRIDQQNVWSALKAVMDGCFVNATTKDDGEKWLTLGSIHQDTGEKWRGKEQVVFTVRPR